MLHAGPVAPPVAADASTKADAEQQLPTPRKEQIWRKSSI